MAKNIRVAIAGSGGWANRHAEVYKAMRGVDVVACCDVEKSKAVAFAEKHQIGEAYDDYKKMFATERLNAVSVVTSDAAHAAVSLAAMKAGLHVLCEKPLATTASDARKMTTMANRTGLINMVDFTYRSAASVHKAKQLVESGKLGDILHVEASYLQSWLVGKFWGDWRVGDQWLWRMSRASGSGGVLGDIGCHILDLACYVAGDLNSIYCQLKHFDKGYKNNTLRGYKLDANESAVLNVGFANGAVGTIHASRWATGHMNDLSLRVFGSKGGLELVLRLDQPWDKLHVCFGANVDRCQWESLSCGRNVSLFESFIKSIRAGKNSQPTFEVGEKIQRYIEACFKSDKTRKPVRV